MSERLTREQIAEVVAVAADPESIWRFKTVNEVFYDDVPALADTALSLMDENERLREALKLAHRVMAEEGARGSVSVAMAQAIPATRAALADPEEGTT